MFAINIFNIIAVLIVVYLHFMYKVEWISWETNMECIKHILHHCKDPSAL